MECGLSASTSTSIEETPTQRHKETYTENVQNNVQRNPGIELPNMLLLLRQSSKRFRYWLEHLVVCRTAANHILHPSLHIWKRGEIDHPKAFHGVLIELWKKEQIYDRWRVTRCQKFGRFQLVIHQTQTFLQSFE